jgi:hypothetical protein
MQALSALSGYSEAPSNLEDELQNLGRITVKFKGIGRLNNYRILKALALSDAPMTGYSMRRIDGLSGTGTVYDRLKDLANPPKPFIQEVSRVMNPNHVVRKILYDLTPRGGIAALLLLHEEPDLRKYARRFGWGSTDMTLRVIQRLAEEDRFWRIVVNILLFLGQEPLLLHSLDDADDFGLLQVIQKDCFRIAAPKLREEGDLRGLVEDANRMLASQGLRTL